MDEQLIGMHINDMLRDVDSLSIRYKLDARECRKVLSRIYDSYYKIITDTEHQEDILNNLHLKKNNLLSIRRIRVIESFNEFSEEIDEKPTSIYYKTLCFIVRNKTDYQAEITLEPRDRIITEVEYYAIRKTS